MRAFHAVILISGIILGSLVACAPPGILERDYRYFQLSAQCLALETLSGTQPIPDGVLWFKEDAYNSLTKPGQPGLRWLTAMNEGHFPMGDLILELTLVSPDKRAFLLYELSTDTIYRVSWTQNGQTPSLKKIPSRLETMGESLTWLNEDTVQGVISDWRHNQIWLVHTKLSTGQQTRIKVHGSGMSDIYPVLAQGALVMYPAQRELEHSLLVVYDYARQREIAQYADVITYMGGHIAYGHLLHPSTQYLLADAYPQQTSDVPLIGTELYGARVGYPIKQITDFHKYYPIAEIYLVQGSSLPKNWSPDARWIWFTARISSSPNKPPELYGFLYDLVENVAYPTCQPLQIKYVHDQVWHPTGRYLAVGIDDKVWILDTYDLNVYLVLDRQGIPIDLLSWTLP